jgi:hypothetical protein
MWFNITLSNHGGKADIIGLSRVVGYLRAMLSLCGHEVTVDYHPLLGAINLYLEHFLGPSWAADFRELRGQQKMKIGVIATELMVSIDGKRLIPYAEHGITYAGDADNRARLNRARIDGFGAVLGEVDFVWAFMQRTAEQCRRDTRVCEFMPYGSIGLVADYARRSPKSIDVLFIGKNTPHRARVLQSLAQHGIKGIALGPGFAGDWVPDCIVESMQDRAKIGLNLTLYGFEKGQTVDPRFASCGRITEMFSRKVCVVSEDIPLDNPYAQFMESQSIDRLGELCREILKEQTWVDKALTNADHFHEAMDVRKVCQPVIERTLAAIA